MDLLARPSHILLESGSRKTQKPKLLPWVTCERKDINANTQKSSPPPPKKKKNLKTLKRNIFITKRKPGTVMR